MIKLSILIPSIKRHSGFLVNLLMELNYQASRYPGKVEILVDESEIDSIGEKRNRLLSKASGEYVAFFDADDRPSSNYITLLMDGISKGVDCCSLKGIITFDGETPGYFEHSIKYQAYRTNEKADYRMGQIKYERFPNHISCIKASVAKQFKFPEKNYGEDTDWAVQIHQSGLLKSEHYINEVLYYYDYIPK